MVLLPDVPAELPVLLPVLPVLPPDDEDDVMLLPVVVPAVVVPPPEVVVPAVELPPVLGEVVVVWALPVPSMSLSEGDTVKGVDAVLPAPSDATIWCSPGLVPAGITTWMMNVPVVLVTPVPVAPPVTGVVLRETPSMAMVTCWPLAKPEPTMVTVSPASPLLGVAIILALPVGCVPVEPVVVVDVPLLKPGPPSTRLWLSAPPEVAFEAVPPEICPPGATFADAPPPPPPIVALPPAVVVPAVPALLLPPAVVDAAGACPPTAKVPWMVTLNELLPCISWSTMLPCTVMPVPRIVTLRVAPSAGFRFTTLLKPPPEAVFAPVAVLVLPASLSMIEPPVLLLRLPPLEVMLLPLLLLVVDEPAVLAMLLSLLLVLPLDIELLLPPVVLLLLLVDEEPLSVVSATV
jgi:hypothetical protein